MSKDNRAAAGDVFMERVRDSGLRVKLSVLDRLLDDAPEMERDRPLLGTDALTVLRRAVRRDLEALLNARRRLWAIPRSYPELANSSMSFGLPDYSAGAMNEPGAREALRRDIERCIKQFEPRLIHVSVLLLPRSDELDATLQLKIDALLHAEPVAEQISFDTIVNAATAEVEVTGE